MIYLFKILKFIGLLLVLWLLYYQVAHGKGAEIFTNFSTDSLPKLEYTYLLMCIVFMPLNWWVEVKKWKILMSPHIKISWLSAWKTILAGVTLGVVTPARIGEYGGRLITSDPDQKTQVISATLLSSIAQNLCNVVIGLCFSYFFLNLIFGITAIDHFTFIVLIFIQISLFIFIYYNLPKVAHFIERKVGTRYIGRYSTKLKLLDIYQGRILHRVLFWSALRYMIYLSQYLFILKFFGVVQSPLDILSGISSIYLIQTGIPMPAFMSLLARGELAIMVWSYFDVPETTALMATFGLWVINLVIPSIIGFFVLMETDLRVFMGFRVKNKE